MNYLIHHLLQSSAAQYPCKQAVVHKTQRLTYTELQSRVRDYAAQLLEAGLQPNDRVGILLPPGIPLVCSIFATSMAGGVFVPIHHSLLENQISHILQDCEVKLVITCHSLANKINPDAATSSLQSLLAVDEGNSLPTEFHRFNLPTLADTDQDSVDAIHFDDTNRVEGDLAAILYTSGSTGLPKGVMLSHKNVVAGASIVSDYLGIHEQDRLLAALPFNFDAGLNQLTTSIQQGATIVLIQFLFAREIVTTIESEKITGLAGVPPLWNLLAQENSTLKKKKPESLRYITNTGGAMTQELLAKLRESLAPSTNIVLMYGLTEAFRSTYLPPDQLDQRPTSMGKAIPNSRIMVIREDGSLCEPNETGELVHQGPTVALGYWGQPEATRKVFREDPNPLAGVGDVDKVVYSGDLVYQDDEGYFYFVGRRDTMIKSSGFRISPTEVEAGIMQTGQVDQVAVVGIPDSVLGQAIVGFVRPIDQNQFETSDLLTESSEFLPRHMLPKIIHLLPEFPKTASGKIDYPALRARAIQLAAEGEAAHE